MQLPIFENTAVVQLWINDNCLATVNTETAVVQLWIRDCIHLSPFGEGYANVNNLELVPGTQN